MSVHLGLREGGPGGTSYPGPGLGGPGLGGPGLGGPGLGGPGIKGPGRVQVAALSFDVASKGAFRPGI